MIMSICIKNGLTVYPIRNNHKWFVQSNMNGVKKTFKQKSLNNMTNELNDAIAATYEYYYDKLFKNVDN